MIDVWTSFLFKSLDKSMLFYNVEIAKCIGKYGVYDRCKGLYDFPEMGIAAIGTFTLELGYRTFFESELQEFQSLIDRHPFIVGFNSKKFDDKLLLANHVSILTTYDLLEEIQLALSRLGKNTKGTIESGYSLDNLAKANLPFHRTGKNTLAPVLCQNREYGKLIDCCLQDTKILLHLFTLKSNITDPIDGFTLKLRATVRDFSNFDDLF